MEMSKSNDLIKAKNLVPWPQQQYRSLESGLQMVNRKKLTDFYRLKVDEFWLHIQMYCQS